MASEEDTSTGASRAQRLFMKTKLALALAIIKSRPPGTSGRQYAEALGRQLKARDDSRREKAQRLRLRQDQLVAQLTALAEAADTRMNENSQDLFGPGSAELEPDMDSETPDLQLSPVSQPPASSPAPPIPVDPPPSPKGDVLLRHVHFLQSLGSLQRLKGCQGMAGNEALWFGPYGDGVPVLEDTLSAILDFVVEGGGSIVLGGRDFAAAACQAAALATDLLGSQRSAAFKARVEKRLKELTGMLLRGKQSSGLQAAKNLKRCLMVLGSSSTLKSLLVGHIVSELSALTDQLWQVIQITDGSGLRRFPLLQYQNSRHLFSALEELLQESNTAWRQEAAPQLRDFQRCLEERVFLLSEEFHLFSLRMWRLGGLIKDPATALSLRQTRRK